ncbi:hypothetical protein JZ751_005931 [Albula glossodonta]|uniref:Sorting nexin C-terminal domain-containing protein n=1 Tax=Albula glossodonta TaxID=121402 RepID=A0A8T2P3E4_9TELE|nr:hypothetical protein JZ751_005931 [Albula glossodonta]
MFSEQMLVYYINIFRDTFWPNGKLAPQNTARLIKTDYPQSKFGEIDFEWADEETGLKAITSLNRVPLQQNSQPPPVEHDALQSLVGQQNARYGIIKIFNALQEVSANKHLLYVLLYTPAELQAACIVKDRHGNALTDVFWEALCVSCYHSDVLVAIFGNAVGFQHRSEKVSNRTPDRRVGCSSRKQSNQASFKQSRADLGSWLMPSPYRYMTPKAPWDSRLPFPQASECQKNA